LPYLFDFWALEHQLPPEGSWRSWVILGGRGAGKTRAGAEWVRAQVEGSRSLQPGRCRRVALVGETYEQVRDVMVEGESGLLACSPPDRRPVWRAGQRKLVWPNGAEAVAYSASDPGALRGAAIRRGLGGRAGQVAERAGCVGHAAILPAGRGRP
jgi:phage terminase large subunit-like protein